MVCIPGDAHLGNSNGKDGDISEDDYDTGFKKRTNLQVFSFAPQPNQDEEEFLYQSCLRLERLHRAALRKEINTKTMTAACNGPKLSEDEKIVIDYLSAAIQVAAELMALIRDEDKLISAVYKYLASKYSRSSQRVAQFMQVI